MKTVFVRPVVLARLLVAFSAAGTLALALSGQQRAEAWPKFATKEKKPCGYCHINPKGNGPRNAAGKWYDEHNESFAGYVPAGAAAAPTPKPSPKATPKAKPGKKPAAKPTPKNPAKK